MQDVLLALLAKEPSHGYELRTRLQVALGPLGEPMNTGQVYVTLSRLERAGLVTVEQVDEVDRSDRKVYQLTAAGQQRVAAWLTETQWPKPAPVDFHLKLVAAAWAGLADPVSLIDAQRRELLRLVRDAQRAAMADPAGSMAGLLLEGAVLRLRADLSWLDQCERHWSKGRGKVS